MPNISINIFLVGVLIVLSGCSTPRVTDTSRSAEEMLLLSDSLDKALEQIDFRRFAGKRVFLKADDLVAVDKNYAIDAFNILFGRQGLIVVADAKDAQFVINVGNGTWATSNNTYLFGVPPSGIPILFAGTLQVPEIAFYKSITQIGICKMRISVWSQNSPRHLCASRKVLASSVFKRMSIFGISYHHTNIENADDIKWTLASDVLTENPNRIHPKESFDDYKILTPSSTANNNKSKGDK